ncbi:MULTISPECIES: IS21-like element helper ATPase IstB [Sporomusa]|jgi:DNA replication protein DnaC|uniref:IS21-like element helper ATPase IstB n=1 Tax=Sporomusa TaxID=2375 RepID=UPI0016661EFF|nr:MULTISPECIES: IS21-like element helper ATPase IstB [Sporomusa]HML32313.1 IS21-like element helper ATPase IstB [Sporomusa sphaeroides]
MTNAATINKLIEMRMTAMADAYRIQLRDEAMSTIPFEDRLGLLVDVEYTSRKNNRLHRLIKNAGFDQPQASIVDINYLSGRKLNKSLIERLATCEYITERHNVIILGATGSGKSYMACALGMAACQQYYTVKYIRLPELLAELAIARGEGTYQKVIAQYKKYSLIIMDEWLLVKLTETEARDLLEIIHARHKKASTLFCSQFAPAGWFNKIEEATLADAILDRIVHDSYVIEIEYVDKEHDKSMREVYGIDSTSNK